MEYNTITTKNYNNKTHIPCMVCVFCYYSFLLLWYYIPLYIYIFYIHIYIHTHTSIYMFRQEAPEPIELRSRKLFFITIGPTWPLVHPSNLSTVTRIGHFWPLSTLGQCQLGPDSAHFAQFGPIPQWDSVNFAQIVATLPQWGPKPPLDSANLAQIVSTLPNLVQFHPWVVPTLLGQCPLCLIRSNSTLGQNL